MKFQKVGTKSLITEFAKYFLNSYLVTSLEPFDRKS